MLENPVVLKQQRMSWEDGTQITPRCLGLQVSCSLWKHVGVLGRGVKTHRKGLFLDEHLERNCWLPELAEGTGMLCLLDMGVGMVPSWSLSDVLVPPGC